MQHKNITFAVQLKKPWKKLIESSSHHDKEKLNRCLKCSTSFSYSQSLYSSFWNRSLYGQNTLSEFVFGNSLVRSLEKKKWKREWTKTITENQTKRKESRQITCDQSRILYGNAQMCNQITIKTHIIICNLNGKPHKKCENSNSLVAKVAILHCIA